MGDLIEFVKDQLGCDLKKSVDARILEFERLGKMSSGDIFKELCFCILTANFTAEGGIRIQQEVGDGFLTMPEPQLARRLKELGHRFPNTRAGYIVGARKHRDSIKGLIDSAEDGDEIREWLVKNVKGIGYKEASHFLRNIGFGDLAIIDFHIVDILVRHGLIGRPKTLTRNRYLEIEKVLQGIAKELGISLAELDLYLWCAETGKVLK